jgi:outer membrane murein-binding lipoprotein Lpp
MRCIIALVAALAVWSGVSSARTSEQLTEDVTDRDRTITQLRNQVERLRYAAGDSIARKGNPVQADHDLLISIAEKINMGFLQVALDKETELSNISAQARELADQREEIERLKIAWSKAIGYAMGASAVVSLLLHFAHGALHTRYRRREPEAARPLIELA